MIEVEIEKPDDVNFILGQTHFIKSIEDLYEAMMHVPNAKFGIAFCEASGKCLIRYEGNDEEMISLAIKNAEKISAGHAFIIFMKNCYPINVLNSIKNLPEVCRIYCATANPTKVLIHETEMGEEKGRAIIGVVDGYKSKGIEKEKDKKERMEFLRNIGYKK
ncbi:MAG: adenosine-specific kinase [Candidatus Thermoplasmatota archaeon]